MAADISLNNGILEVAGTNYNDVIELRIDRSDRLGSEDLMPIHPEPVG